MIDCTTCKRFKGWGLPCCDGMDFPHKDSNLGSCSHYIKQ